MLKIEYPGSPFILCLGPGPPSLLHLTGADPIWPYAGDTPLNSIIMPHYIIIMLLNMKFMPLNSIIMPGNIIILLLNIIFMPLHIIIMPLKSIIMPRNIKVMLLNILYSCRFTL